MEAHALADKSKRFWCLVLIAKLLLCPARTAGALSDDARLTSVAYIGPKSRSERPRKTKIGTDV